MNRTLLTSLLLGGLLLAASPAHAQMFGSNTTLRIEPPTDTFHAFGQMQTVPGALEFVADATAMANLQGIPFEIHVTRLPAWLNVAVTPATGILPISPGVSPTVYAVAPFEVTMTITDDLQRGQLTDQVELQAIVAPPAPYKGSSGKVNFPVVLDIPEEDPACDNHTLVAYATLLPGDAGQDVPAEDEGAVTVQSTQASAVPLSTMAIGGFALVGAGVGLVLRRKFR